MGKSAKQRLFVASINEEGKSRVLRAKVPSGLIQILGGGQGDVLQFEVTGKFLTGGRVLHGEKAEIAKQGVYNQSRDIVPPSKPKAAASPQGNGKVPRKPILQPGKVAIKPKKMDIVVKGPKVKKIIQPTQSKISTKPVKPSKRKTQVDYKPTGKIPLVGKSGKIKLKPRK